MTVGWDEGITTLDGGMSLGEKAVLTITGYVCTVTPEHSFQETSALVVVLYVVGARPY